MPQSPQEKQLQDLYNKIKKEFPNKEFVKKEIEKIYQRLLKTDQTILKQNRAINRLEYISLNHETKLEKLSTK